MPLESEPVAGGKLLIEPSNILYEDNHYIAYRKAIGQLVQGDRTGDMPLVDALALYIAQRDAKPGTAFLQPVHRIDRPVSGVVLFAKTTKGLVRANEIFREHQAERTYWAIVQTPPPAAEGKLEGYLRRDTKRNKSLFTPHHRKNAQLANLSYRLVGTSTRNYFLEVNLETGRHHQIRALLAAHGIPVRGDLKYGAPRSNPGGGIDLHARSLAFTHPVDRKQPRRVEIIAQPPRSTLWDLFCETADSGQATGQLQKA